MKRRLIIPCNGRIVGSNHRGINSSTSPGSYLSEIMVYYVQLFQRITAYIDCLDSLINWAHSSAGTIDYRVVVADLVVVVEEPTTGCWS